MQIFEQDCPTQSAEGVRLRWREGQMTGWPPAVERVGDIGLLIREDGAGTRYSRGMPVIQLRRPTRLGSEQRITLSIGKGPDS